MPSRKISEREKLTTYARTASEDELAQALEIFQIESRVRTAAKATVKKPAGNKVTKAEKAPKDPASNAEPTDGPQG